MNFHHIEGGWISIWAPFLFMALKPVPLVIRCLIKSFITQFIMFISLVMFQQGSKSYTFCQAMVKAKAVMETKELD